MNRIEELEVMIKFADELLEEYEKNHVPAPKLLYDKMILLYDELIGVLKEDTKRMEIAIEAMRSANKVIESKGVQN